MKKITLKDLKFLYEMSRTEGAKLAQKVKTGEVTRKEVQDAYDQWHDMEAYVALKWLDRWNIK